MIPREHAIPARSETARERPAEPDIVDVVRPGIPSANRRDAGAMTAGEDVADGELVRVDEGDAPTSRLPDGEGVTLLVPSGVALDEGVDERVLAGVRVMLSLDVPVPLGEADPVRLEVCEADDEVEDSSDSEGVRVIDSEFVGADDSDDVKDGVVDDEANSLIEAVLEDVAEGVFEGDGEDVMLTEDEPLSDDGDDADAVAVELTEGVAIDDRVGDRVGGPVRVGVRVGRQALFDDE